MGSVWRAENVRVHKDVAIKLMHPQYARQPTTLSRFRNEATSAGRIGNQHICDILDFGESPIGPYIVMELLRGRSLDALMEECGRIEPGLVVLIVRQALEGLDAAHRAGIVHRDLKPENVFLHEPEPGRLWVKLMDFGISKFTEASGDGKTGIGVLMGTPDYMSPEQAEGAANVDLRTDIWAIGVIMYRALTGVDAFAGPTLAATLVNLATRDPKPIRELVPEVPSGLERIVATCLAKDPARRFQTAHELRDALTPFEHISPLPSLPEALDSLPSASPDKGLGSWSSELGSSPTSSPNLDAQDSWSMGAAGLPASTPGVRRQQGIRGVALALVSVVVLAAGGVMVLIVRSSESAESPSEPSNDVPPGPVASAPMDIQPPANTPSPLPTTTSSGASVDTDQGSKVVADEHESKSVDDSTSGEQPTTSDEQPKGGGRHDSGRKRRRRVDPTPKIDVSKLVQAGSIYTPKTTRRQSTHADAQNECSRLTSVEYAGLSEWRLATPAEVASFKSMNLDKTMYWTSEMQQDKAVAVNLGLGEQRRMLDASAKARAFCVARR